MKNGNSEDFEERYRKEGKSSEWTLERIREACEKVAKNEIGRLGIVQEIQRKSTDFLRRVMAPVNGMGGVILSYVTGDGLTFGSKRLVESRENCNGLQLCGHQDLALSKDVGRAVWGRRLALLGPVGQRLRTASTYWIVPGKYGPHGELFFSL